MTAVRCPPSAMLLIALLVILILLPLITLAARQPRRPIWFTDGQTVRLDTGRYTPDITSVTWQMGNLTLGTVGCGYYDVARNISGPYRQRLQLGPYCVMQLRNATRDDTGRVTARDNMGNVARLSLVWAGPGLRRPLLWSYSRLYRPYRLAVCRNPNDPNTTQLSIESVGPLRVVRINKRTVAAMVPKVNQHFWCTVTRAQLQATTHGPSVPPPPPCTCPGCPACPPACPPARICPCTVDQCNLPELWPAGRLQSPYLGTTYWISILAYLTSLVVNGLFFTILWCACPEAAPGRPVRPNRELQAVARVASGN